MSYPLQPYNPNLPALATPGSSRTVAMNNPGLPMSPLGDLFGSLLGIANQIVSQVLQNGPSPDGFSALIGADLNNPNVQMIGMTSMNMMQISQGPDGRPQVIQALEERRLGPNGMWQTKKALRDPERGIDKMQVGYFIGNRGEIIERRYDPITGQYREDVQRRSFTPNDSNFAQAWGRQNSYPMQHPYSYNPTPAQFLAYQRPAAPQLALPAPAAPSPRYHPSN